VAGENGIARFGSKRPYEEKREDQTDTVATKIKLEVKWANR
jgi:hypothetical protein